MEPPKTVLLVAFSGPDHDSRFSGQYTQHSMDNNRLTYKRDSDRFPDETFLLFKRERNNRPVSGLFGALDAFNRTTDLHAPRWAFVRPNAMGACIKPDLAVNINSSVDKESAKLYYSRMSSFYLVTERQN